MQVYVVSREEEWVNKLKNEIVAIFSDLEKAKTFCQEMALEISHNVIVSDEPERSHEDGRIFSVVAIVTVYNKIEFYITSYDLIQ